MTHDAADTLAARVSELMQADDRIVAAARGRGRDTVTRAVTVLEAIADRNRVASAVLEAIFVEDQAIHARLDATAITAEGGTTLATHLVPRDRAIDSLAAIVERSSRENSRIARRLEAGLAKLEAPPGPA